MLRRRVRLRQLELLAALARAPTLSAAARAVNLSQPAASKLLNRLAADLGVALFERAGRTLRPTAAGQALLRRAAALIGDLDRAQDELGAIGEGLVGSARLGAGVGSCYVLVPHALVDLLDGAPDISVTVREGTIGELLGGLRAGHFDLVVGRLDTPLTDRTLAVEELYDPPMQVVCGPRHPLVRRRDLRWGDVADAEWVLPEDGTPMRRGLDALFRRLHRPPRRALIESSSVQTNVALLSQRDLLWVLSADIADYFARFGALRVLPLPRLQGPSPLVLAYLRDRSLSPAAARLRDSFKRATAEILSGSINHQK
ncbi:MAG: LysR family transcriptional regulator [Pseudolabrys sp.]|nr:LysR family transcriptional regulator [Pseudolabrys sp.]MCW5686797.1 LysR family transcriptional regulator [Pseudolabrys sp.]